MHHTTLLQVDGLSRFYGPLEAVKNISFEVRQGEVLGFLGPNGAGKTTTMQMLTGNLAPSQGRINVAGHDLLDDPRAAPALTHLPPFIILDEPTAGLDPIQIREIRHLVRELGKEHSVILSTHILTEVQTVCSHVQIINKGELVLNVSSDDLAQRMQSSVLTLRFRNTPDLAATA